MTQWCTLLFRGGDEGASLAEQAFRLEILREIRYLFA